MLAIGAGMLALAGGGTLPAVLQGAYATNAVVAMHNSPFLLSAGCLFVASLTAVGVVPLQLPGSRVAHVAAAYTVVVVCVGAVLALVVTGRMPTFFVQGQGPTELRQVVLVVALCLFGLAAVFWWQAYVRVRLPFLRWFYLAMALFCLAPVALLLQTSVGSAIGWVGRCAQYIAVPYVLIAVLSVRAAAGAGGIENRFAAALLQATLPYRPLLDSVTEAIVVLDDRGAVLYWNDAATRMFGVGAAESFGADFAGLIAPEPRQQELRAALQAHATSPDTPTDRLTTTAVDSNGRQFPVEAAFYGNRLGGRELAICVVALLNHAEYEYHHHAPEFLRSGGSPAQLAALGRVASSDIDMTAFDDAERAVLALAVEMTRTIEVGAPTMASVRGALASDRHVVEIVAIIATYNMVSRFLVALGVEPE